MLILLIYLIQLNKVSRIYSLAQTSLPGNNYSPVTIDCTISDVSESSYIISRRVTGAFFFFGDREVEARDWGVDERGIGEQHFISGLVIEMR